MNALRLMTGSLALLLFAAGGALYLTRHIPVSTYGVLTSVSIVGFLIVLATEHDDPLRRA